MRKSSEHKRIVFLIGNLQRHGAEKVIVLLAEHFHKEGWAVDILTLLDEKCDYPLSQGLRHIPVCRPNKRYAANILFWIRGIRRFMRAEQPQAVVSFVARINLLTILACLGLKMRIIASERNDPSADGRSLLTRLATHVLYGYADCIVFQTKWAQSCFPSGIRQKGVVIPNPVRVSTRATAPARGKIVAVGRMEPQKNHCLLLDAFSVIRKRHPECVLHIYGDGSLMETIETRAQELNIRDSVILPGSVPDVHEKIADAAMFVLPSDYEGLSNALLEALMMGLPCISTRCAGSNEAIRDGVNGLLVPVRSGEKLAEAMERLLEDRELAGRLGAAAALLSEPYCCETVLRQWDAAVTGGPREASAV